MTAKPAYFEDIRSRAAKRWEQLEGDPELAGPWHQLFKQVQSPRHILSELLQNADDAGATEASVRIEDGCFLFSHNGEDFTKDHFASLCRFGYSNKRALHTIGFRGIGFKSTFSLGERVELYTPSLSIAFDQKRFTEPFWIDGSRQQRDETTIRVEISDEHRQREVEKNLEEWIKSPVSLLFFRNIRRINIRDKEVHWGSFGAGPVKDTEWLALHKDPEKKFLLARSEPEHFPEDALREIRQERMLSAEQDMTFPPCQIEIVVGVEGRLFVVLPTGVKTDLPFATNAPFIQDPARLKIKDPETSPTNRWLLERAGRLAADVMLSWLRNSKLHPEERAAAYDVMPDVNRESSSLDGVCGAIAEKAFEEAIYEQDLLLTDDGSLTDKDGAVVLPRQLFQVWPQEQATTLFDEQGRPPLSHHVSESNLTKLKNWSAVEEIDNQDVLNVLQEKPFPKPASWRQLLTLWAYVNRLLQSYDYYCTEEDLRIVPVQSKDALFSASEVVRLGEKRMVPSDEDWEFLGERLSVLSQNWMRFLTEQRRNAENNKDKALHKLTEGADNLLEAIGLNEPSDTGKVIDQVAETFFAESSVKLKDAIRLAQISAKLGAQIHGNFRFASQDRRLRPISKTVIYDQDGSLALLLPDEWAEEHILHPDYTKQFTSCTKEEWIAWVESGRAGLEGFAPLKRTSANYWTELQMQKMLHKRGFEKDYYSRYSNPSFNKSDWDFSESIWEHWDNLEEELPAIWARVVERILAKPSQWSNYLSASVHEIASNGHERRIIREGLVPQWLFKLKEKQCLPDTHGVLRKPSELLMRTPATEALMDVEPFVHGLLDNEATRQLLRLLGVSDQPTGPEKILTRLQGLAQIDTPPAHEVDKWYRRLDQLIDGCSTEAFQAIRKSFETGRLILTEDGVWENVYGVFLSAGEGDVPDVQLVRSSVQELTLWRKIGVGDRPTADLAIEWLQKLPSGKALPADDVRRVRTLLSRYPSRVWNECGHWLNLAGEWAPTGSFSYALTMQTLTRWSHLHQWVKQKTADLQALSTELIEADPFSSLPPLAAQIEERFNQKQAPDGVREERSWLLELGAQLRRIKLDDEQEAQRIRDLASILNRTLWLTSKSIEIVPYIDGKPAGTARQADVLWLGNTLYAEDKPLAKLAKAVAQELGKAFRRPEIADAIKLCFDRDPEFVRSYVEENFELLAPEDIEPDDASDAPYDEEETPNDISDDSVKPEPTEATPDDTDATPDVDDVNLVDHVDADLSEDIGQEQKPDVEDDDGSDEEELATPQPRKPRTTRPQLIERYATSQGFRKDGDHYYFNDHGASIGKANGSLFPWEWRSSSGDVQKRLLPKEHCLEKEPLQLEAEIWGVLEQNPETYLLVLVNPDDEPVEVSGKLLTELRDRGVLALHPSTYRLVIEHDKQT